MVQRLILGLLWLTCVQSDSLNSMPIASTNKMSMDMSSGHMSSGSSEADQMSIKTKRYLSHQHASPCPPFYPHFHMHMPMYSMRPYGPPAYPKNDIHMTMQHPQQHHHDLQYVHQPTYASYVPKQTIQYVKPVMSMPEYQHQPIVSSPIHQHQPIVMKQPPLQPIYHQYQHQPMYQPKISYEKQPIYSYAPAYHHKPMSVQWPMPQIKKIDYPITQVTYNHPKPAILFKPEAPKCAPCPPATKPVHQPSISYVKAAEPIHHVQYPQSKIYLPAPVHQPIVQPCDK